MLVAQLALSHINSNEAASPIDSISFESIEAITIRALNFHSLSRDSQPPQSVCAWLIALATNPPLLPEISGSPALPASAPSSVQLLRTLSLVTRSSSRHIF